MKTQGVLGIGEIVGPILGGILFTLFGLRVAFTVTAIIVSVNLLGVLFIRRTEDVQEEVLTPFETRAIERQRSQSTKPWKEIRQDPAIIAATIAIIGASASWGFLETILQNHLEMTLGLSIIENGFTFAVVAFCYAVVSLRVHRLCERFDEGVVMTAGLILISLSFLFLGPIPPLHKVIHNKVEAWATVLLPLIGVGTGMAFVYAPAFSLLLQRSGESNTDLASFMFSTTIQFGAVIGPILGGLVSICVF